MTETNVIIRDPILIPAIFHATARKTSPRYGVFRTVTMASNHQQELTFNFKLRSVGRPQQCRFRLLFESTDKILSAVNPFLKRLIHSIGVTASL